MSTLVCFHAHPDDEAIATGGTMALAAEQGHRVVLVVATRGEHGEPVEGALADGEPLWQRRITETFAAAEVLGASRVEFLGYVDSGMMGEPTNDFPYAFWQADVEQAAHRLAAILREEGADVLTVYDDHGGYGHPDHIQVHRVGMRAAELCRTPVVLQATMNRDRIRASIAEARERMEQAGQEIPDEAEIDRSSFGTPEAEITHAVDVSTVLERKRSAMTAHASQIGEDSWFLTMEEQDFATAFATEWFIHGGHPRPEGAAFVGDVWSTA